jgi:mannose-6-phosphate isomerase-like protein (cupin superfamily)
MYQPVNLENKFSLFDAHWQPKVIAQMNDYQFKIVKISGDFIWHAHPETDEAFIVVEGVLRIDFRDGHVLVNPGKCTLCQKALNIKRLLKQR